MRTRGRVSAQALGTGYVGKQSASGSGKVELTPRLLPPKNLTEEEKAIWKDVVSQKPAEWFGPEHAPMLSQYCRHAAMADDLAKRIAAMPPRRLKLVGGQQELSRLMRMHALQSRMMNMLTRSMRINQRSMYGATQAATATKRAKAGKTTKVPAGMLAGAPASDSVKSSWQH